MNRVNEWHQRRWDQVLDAVEWVGQGGLSTRRGRAQGLGNKRGSVASFNGDPGRGCGRRRWVPGRLHRMKPPTWLSGRELRQVRQSEWLFSWKTPVRQGGGGGRAGSGE